MDAKTAATATNTNNFEPLSDFVQEGDCDTLLLYLPGFTKEQLRVQLARSGVLKISGTRPLGDNKWSSFQKDFPVSANCDTNKITAKFEDGVLYVRQPKLIVPAPDKEAQKLTPPAKETNQEQPHKTTPDKPTPSKEDDKPTKDHERKSSESSEGTTKLDDTPPEKTAGSAQGDKRENAELANKGTSNYRTDAAKLLDDGYKLEAGSPAAKLKVARQKMTTVLVVLIAFAVGMFINKLQAWFSREAN
ncbi:protein restricted tev movement 2 [Phtheirospermum japonicum]|uniref:Protein restricted tev movement 2 n=1 Tax=Phtheirospermum japonicum TaxID=374723 RepID=A0A830BTB1_9LAMI|nr:protein restricted tev movement 2 [Phtheirospermum japonicum]